MRYVRRLVRSVLHGVSQFFVFLDEECRRGIMVGSAIVALALFFGSLLFIEHRANREWEEQRRRIEAEISASAQEYPAGQDVAVLLLGFLQNTTATTGPERVRSLYDITGRNVESASFRILVSRRAAILDILEPSPGFRAEIHRTGHVSGWGVFWMWFSIAAWFTVWTCAFTGFTNSYGGRICNLPWREGWPWAFALFTAPLSTPCFLVSGAYLYRLDRREERACERNAVPDSVRATTDGAPALAPAIVRLSGSTPEALAASREHWRHLRGEGRVRAWQERVAHLQSERDGQRERLAQYGVAIEQAQREGAAVARELHAIEATPPPNESVDATARARFDEEFDRLLALPAVRRVEVDDRSITVWAGPIIVRVSGRRFDLGDYRIRLGTTVDDQAWQWPQVSCAHPSTRRDGVRMLLYSNSGTFCFGNCGDQLAAVLQRGEFLPALAIVIEALHTVNPGDERRVVGCYQEVADEDVRLVPAT